MIRLRYVIVAGAMAVILAAAGLVLALIAAHQTIEWMKGYSTISPDATPTDWDRWNILATISYSLQQFAGPLLLAAMIAGVTAVILATLRARVRARA